MKHRGLVLGLTCIMALAFMASNAPSESYSGPQAMVRALFAAAARGDFAAVRRLCTGRALQGFSGRGQAIKDRAALKRLGRSFIKSRGVKILTLAVVALDVKKGMTPAQKAALKRVLSHLRRAAAKAKSPAVKHAILQKAAQLERAVGQLTLKLVYRDGRWLVAEIL